MNHGKSNDLGLRPEKRPFEPLSRLADLQVKAYEERVRERLAAKYPTRTPTEAGRLEKQIQRLVQIYAEGRILLQGDPPYSIRRGQHLRQLGESPELEITHERE